MIDSERFILDCNAIRSQNPLVHNITNYVAMNFAANALLAIGASPLMSFYPAEMEEVVGLSAAVSINLGCLDDQIIKASEIAAGTAMRCGKPWVLDPVGAGVSAVRTTTACRLALDFHPSIIRGNAAEIAAMVTHICGGGKAAGCDNARGKAGSKTGGGSSSDVRTEGESITDGTGQRGVDCDECQRGVDCTTNDVDWAKSVAMRLAEVTGSVVVASGETDCVTDGKRVELITRGCPTMAKVTAMGCSETTVCAAFAAVDSDPFYAAVGAMLLYGIAGEVAAQSALNGVATPLAVDKGEMLASSQHPFNAAVPPLICRGWQSCEGYVLPGSFQIAFLDALSDFSLIRKKL